MNILRSWLFVPANQSRMIDRSFSLNADVLIYDLEDSVPDSEKSRGRELVSAAISASHRRSSPYVRINAVNSGQLESDLEAVVVAGLAGIVLPKVECPEQVQELAALIDEREAAIELAPGGVRVAATLESAQGVLNAGDIAASSERLVALLFGAEDLKLDLGHFDFCNAGHDEMLFARSSIAMAAAASRLAAVDRVIVDFRNTELLLDDCRQGRALGFHGKAVVHPAQIDGVNQAFSPMATDVEKARRVMAAFDGRSDPTAGSVAVDGEMVDLPIVERARQIVAYAEAIKRLEC